MTLKIIHLHPRATHITDAEGCISDEAFTLDELSKLQHFFWFESQITPLEEKAALLSRLESIFAALGNDTDAIILHVNSARNLTP